MVTLFWILFTTVTWTGSIQPVTGLLGGNDADVLDKSALKYVFNVSEVKILLF
jgi:hypothetical protein